MTQAHLPDAAPSPARPLSDQAFARSAGAPLLTGNSVELLFDSTQNFPAWRQAIASARVSVMIEMYLFADDPFGQEILDLLIARARAGRPWSISDEMVHRTSVKYMGTTKASKG